MDLDIKVTPVFTANYKAWKSGKYRVIGNQGATRSSKSYSICQLLIWIACNFKVEISICSLSLPHLKRGVMRDIISILEDWKIYNEADHNKTDFIYRFPKTGSYIEFFGVENAEKLRGPGRDILYINEANLITRDAYLQLAFRTRGQIFVDYNPSDLVHWIYDVVDEPANKLIISTYRNNLANLPTWQVEEIERLKALDENLWKVYGLGQRGASTELVYSHWKLFSSTPRTPDETYYGLDFGFNNPSALVRVDVIDRAAYITEMLYQTKLTNTDLIDAIKGLGIRGTIYCDAAEPDRIVELQRAGIDAVKADKSVKDGINSVKSTPLYFHRDSLNIQKEAKGYKWKTGADGKPDPDEPVKFLDHALDAMRYAIYTHNNRPNIKFLVG